MKILITGAAGFIASKIAAMLAQRGDEVIQSKYVFIISMLHYSNILC